MGKNARSVKAKKALVKATKGFGKDASKVSNQSHIELSVDDDEDSDWFDPHDFDPEKFELAMNKREAPGRVADGRVYLWHLHEASLPIGDSAIARSPSLKDAIVKGWVESYRLIQPFQIQLLENVPQELKSAIVNELEGLCSVVDEIDYVSPEVKSEDSIFWIDADALPEIQAEYVRLTDEEDECFLDHLRLPRSIPMYYIGDIPVHPGWTEEQAINGWLDAVKNAERGEDEIAERKADWLASDYYKELQAKQNEPQPEIHSPNPSRRKQAKSTLGLIKSLS